MPWLCPLYLRSTKETQASLHVAVWKWWDILICKSRYSRAAKDQLWHAEHLQINARILDFMSISSQCWQLQGWNLRPSLQVMSAIEGSKQSWKHLQGCTLWNGKSYCHFIGVNLSLTTVSSFTLGGCNCSRLHVRKSGGHRKVVCSTLFKRCSFYNECIFWVVEYLQGIGCTWLFCWMSQCLFWRLAIWLIGGLGYTHQNARPLF